MRTFKEEVWLSGKAAAVLMPEEDQNTAAPPGQAGPGHRVKSNFPGFGHRRRTAP
jgi:hypothetical protein